MAPSSKGKDEPIKLTPIKKQIIEVPIVGVTPVIPHRWSEKALRMMREAQSGPKARQKHEPKDPVAEAEGCLYRLPDDRPGMPATSFKAAIGSAARLYQGITMTSIKQVLNVVATDPEDDQQLVAIDGPLTLREDTPRNSNGSADLRYRYMIWPWRALLTIEFVPTLIDPESLVNLVDASGFGGVGDWRPSAPKSLTGTFGRYEVELP